MKVIQVIPRFGLAGAETMCQNLSCSLKDLGIDVLVVSLYNYKSSLTEKLENSGINVIYLNKRKGLQVSLIKRLYRIFIKEKPDVVHTHMNSIKYAMPAAIFAHVQVKIHTVHNMAEKETSTWMTRTVHKMLFHAGRVKPVALTPAVKNSISTIYKLEKDKIPMVYNGIDISNCIKKEDYDVKSSFTFLNIGRFEIQKNQIGLVEAFAIFKKKYPNSKLKIIGDGKMKKDIEASISNYGIESSVELLGLQDNVFPFLKDSDCFILPSHFEGMPITLIEAMGTGLPIIATKVGGVPDMIRDGINGLLCDVEVNEIVEKMEQMYLDKELRMKLGLSALSSSNDFSAWKMAESYIMLYSKG